MKVASCWDEWHEMMGSLGFEMMSWQSGESSNNLGTGADYLKGSGWNNMYYNRQWEGVCTKFSYVDSRYF